MEDEPLFGLIATYGRQMKVADWPSFIVRLFGYRAGLSTGLAYNLDRVAEQTAESVGMTGVQLASQLTLYPYYASFCSDGLAQELLARMLKNRMGRQPGEFEKFLQRPPMLRLCRRCFNEDQSKGIAARWRRCHQLPGAIVCPRHFELLWQAPVRSHEQKVWPTPSAVGDIQPISIKPDDCHMIAIHRVSEVSAALLHGTTNSINLHGDRDWIGVARNCGYARSANTLDSRCLTRDLIEFYGKEYLDRCGLYPANKMNWVAGRIRGQQVAAAALPNILLHVFFERRGSEISDVWPTCPSRYADHGAFHPVEVRTRSKGKYFCYCRCGMSFTTENIADSRSRRVVISVYGEPYAVRALQLADSGLSTAKIGIELGVAKSTARLLAGRAQRFARTPLKPVADLRALNWSAAVEEATTLRAAIKSHSALYRQVRRFRPELLEASQTKNDKRKNADNAIQAALIRNADKAAGLVIEENFCQLTRS